MIEHTCRQLAEVVAAVLEPVVAVVVGLELCWHFEFVHELVESLKSTEKKCKYDSFCLGSPSAKCNYARIIADIKSYLDWCQLLMAT